MLKKNGPYLAHRDPGSASPASRELEARGLTVVRQVFSAEEIAALKGAASEVFDNFPADGRAAGRPVEEDNMFRYEMLNRSAAAQKAVGHRGILDVIEPLLGEDCHVIANTAWRNTAGFAGTHGGGNWHIDAGPHVPMPEGVSWPEDIPHPVFAVGVHIYLEPCGLDDGPTGVIPGSHLSGQYPPKADFQNPDLKWNGQGVEPIIAAAGDVGFFVSDVWHRRMPTGPADQGRFFLQVHYGRRDIAQRLRTTASVNQLSEEAVSRARDERERQLLGLHSPLFYDG